MIRENRLYDELKIGETASLKRVCTENDLFVFAHASGSTNPLHLPNDEHDDLEAVAPSMWVGALFSSVLGNLLPGPGTLYRSQTLTFFDRARVGDEITLTVTVIDKRPGNVVAFETVATGRDGGRLAEGVAEVLAPTRKVRLEDLDVPNLIIQRHRHFDALLDKAEMLDPLVTAVAAPEGRASLGGAMLAARHGIITPILIGDRAAIEAAAEAEEEDLDGVEIIEAEDHASAAAKAVELAHTGRAGAVMKGHLHTSDLLRHVLKKDGGLRTPRRVSHAFVMDVPGLDHLLIVSDAAVNIAPDLEDKVDITQNAIDLARSLGVEEPKAGILSAIETVNPKIQSTLDAAALSKMAERGQITGGLVDGPLAMDNAMDTEAARSKGITSLVAGHADILIVPNLEAGNMLAKELAFVAHAEAAGVALGATVPIILTSRADGEKARLASCAIAALHNDWKQRKGGAGSP